MSTPKGILNDEPRDKQIAQAYRDAVRADATPAGPPIALDDAIRAAARRAAHAGPETLESATRRAEFIATGGFLWRWRAPLGAAASLALAIGIAIKIYDTGEADIAVEKSRSTRGAAPAQMADTGIESRTLSETDQARNRDQQPGVGAPTESQDVGRSKEDAPRLAVQSAPTPSDTPRTEPTAERPTFREGVAASADAERQRLAPGAPALKRPQEEIGRAHV